MFKFGQKQFTAKEFHRQRQITNIWNLRSM